MTRTTSDKVMSDGRPDRHTKGEVWGGKLKAVGEKKLFIAYLIALTVFLCIHVVDQPWITDESMYLLLVKQASAGSVYVENGVRDKYFPQLIIHATAPVKTEDGIRLTGIPAPFYQFLAVPFYLALGRLGLNLMNLASFLATTVLAFYFSKNLFKREWIGFYTAVLYSLCTYSVIYSVEMWPHSISVLASVYPVYAVLFKKGKITLAFAGAVSAVAMGIRYVNLLFAGVLMAYLLHKRRFRLLAAYTAGFGCLAMVLFTYNSFLYSSPLSSGYGSNVLRATQSYRLSNLLLGGAGFIMWSLRDRLKAAYSGLGNSSRLAVLISAYLIVLGLNYMGFFHPVQNIYSELVDFSYNPSFSFLPEKNAVLQSSPILFAAAYGYYNRKRLGLTEDQLGLLVALPLIQVLFIAGLDHGDGSVKRMRYLLEGVFFMSIVGFAYVYCFFKDSGRNPLKLDNMYVYIFTGSALYAIFDLAASDQYRFWINKIPLAVVLGFIASKRANWNRLSHYLMVCAIMVSLLTNIVGLQTTMESRLFFKDAQKQMSKWIRDDSLVIVEGTLEGFMPTALKEDRRIDVAQMSMSDKDINRKLIRHYLDEKRHVYIVSDIGSNFTVKDIGFRQEKIAVIASDDVVYQVS